MRGRIVQGVVCFALLYPSVSAAASYYSFQLGSFLERADAVQAYSPVSELPEARIERIGKYYVLRVGLWGDESEAERTRRSVTQFAPDASLRTVFYKAERIIASPRTKPSGPAHPSRDEPTSQVGRDDAEQPVLYSFQLGSFPQPEDAFKLYERAKTLPETRVEQIGKYYTVRCGFWKDRSTAQAFRAQVARIVQAALLRTTHADPDRILKQNFQAVPAQEKPSPGSPAAQPAAADGVQYFRLDQDNQTESTSLEPAAQPHNTVKLGQDFFLQQDRQYVSIVEAATEITPEHIGQLRPARPVTEVLPLALSTGEEVVYLEDNLITVDLESMSLRQVLKFVSQHRGVKITSTGPIDEEISVKFSEVPLGEGLERILKGRNYLLIFEGKGRLLKEIKIYSLKKKQTPPPRGWPKTIPIPQAKGESPPTAEQVLELNEPQRGQPGPVESLLPMLEQEEDPELRQAIAEAMTGLSQLEDDLAIPAPLQGIDPNTSPELIQELMRVHED